MGQQAQGGEGAGDADGGAAESCGERGEKCWRSGAAPRPHTLAPYSLVPHPTVPCGRQGPALLQGCGMLLTSIFAKPLLVSSPDEGVTSLFGLCFSPLFLLLPPLLVPFTEPQPSSSQALSPHLPLITPSALPEDQHPHHSPILPSWPCPHWHKPFRGSEPHLSAPTFTHTAILEVPTLHHSIPGHSPGGSLAAGCRGRVAELGPTPGVRASRGGGDEEDTAMGGSGCKKEEEQNQNQP